MASALVREAVLLKYRGLRGPCGFYFIRRELQEQYAYNPTFKRLVKPLTGGAQDVFGRSLSVVFGGSGNDIFGRGYAFAEAALRVQYGLRRE